MRFLPGSVLITDDGVFSWAVEGEQYVCVFTEKELEKIGREIARSAA